MSQTALPDRFPGTDATRNCAEKLQQATNTNPVLICAPYIGLILAVLLAYSNVYRNEFLYDDFQIIVNNDFLRHWNTLPSLLESQNFAGAGLALGFYRPLVMLLYFIVYQLFGTWAPAYHAVNVALHVANACLAYRLGCRLGLLSWTSFSAALLWALHPLHAEAVTYISGTADPLYSFLCLVALLTLLPDFAPPKFWLAGLLFLLALCSKESAAVFPALVTITLFVVSHERLRPATYLKTLPLWLLATVYVAGMLTLTHANSPNVHNHDILYVRYYAHNLPNRILTFLATLPAYVGLIVWPSNLHMDRSFPIFTDFWSWQVFCGASMLALVVLRVYFAKGCNLILTWGLVWCLVAYSPSSGIIIPVDGLVYEHWMYLPSVGIAIGLAHTASAWFGRRSKKLRIITATLVVGAALFLGMKTHFQNEVWRNAGTLNENILRSGEPSSRAHNNLGIFYLTRGNFAEASEHFRVAIAHPEGLQEFVLPWLHYDLALTFLGVKADQSGVISRQAIVQVLPLTLQLPEAIQELKTSLDIDPTFYWASETLAVIYSYQGDYEKTYYYDERTRFILRQQHNPS